MPGIPFIKDFKFDYGTATAVTPLIRRVVANNPSPFTFKGTGTYVVGHGKVAIVDPGPDQQEHIDRATRDLTDGIEKAALQALADRKPGRLAWGQGTVGFAMHQEDFL